VGVTQATLIAVILYSAPALWGFLSVAEKDRIESKSNATASYEVVLKKGTQSC